MHERLFRARNQGRTGPMQPLRVWILLVDRWRHGDADLIGPRVSGHDHITDIAARIQGPVIELQIGLTRNYFPSGPKLLQ